jgi:hypothetical protein
MIKSPSGFECMTQCNLPTDSVNDAIITMAMDLARNEIGLNDECRRMFANTDVILTTTDAALMG